MQLNSHPLSHYCMCLHVTCTMCLHVTCCPPGPPLPILSQLGRLPPHLPQQASELPPGWRMLPEQAGQAAQYFMLHNTQYLALNARMNPKVSAACGCCWLLLVGACWGC